MTLTIAICTKNRPDSLYRLLKSLAKSHNCPDSYLIIDDISGQRPTSATNIRQIIKTIPYKIHKVKFNSISRSRNFTLQHSHSDILLFIDDDVEVTSNIVRQFKENHQRFPNVAAFVPTLDSPSSNSLYQFVTDWMNYGFDKNDHLTPRLICPGVCLSLNLPIINKYKIKFPSQLKHISEDTIFSLRITSRLPLLHDPNIHITHHFGQRSSIQVFQRFYAYGQSEYLKHINFQSLYQYSNNWMFPGRILDIIFLPIYFLKVVLKSCQIYITDTLTQPKNYLYVFLAYTLYTLGAYSKFPFKTVIFKQNA